MLKFKQFCESSESSDAFSLDNLQIVLNKVGRWNKHVESKLSLIIDNYDKDYVQEYLNLCRSVYRKTLEWIQHNKIPFYEVNQFVGQFFSGFEFELNEKKLWPVTVYVAATPDEYKDWATVGLLLYENGIAEMFEGNDEATPETIVLVNKLIGVGTEMKLVWSCQPQKIVDEFMMGFAPEGIWISPYRQHAAAYWGDDRTLCCFKIALTNINQESHLDWKIVQRSQIKNLKTF